LPGCWMLQMLDAFLHRKVDYSSSQTWNRVGFDIMNIFPSEIIKSPEV